MSSQARLHILRRIALSGTAIFALTGPAFAEPASEAALRRPGEAGAGVEEVIVTAQKRSESIQQVPVTVNALSGRFLQTTDELGAAHDIAAFVPNFNAAATDGRERPRWFVRGLGTNNTATNAVSPIGVYIDEIYLANVYAQAFPIFDLERVEVLSGPQGTLWGKNTTGGAISYVSKAPTQKFEGFAKATFGSNHEFNQQGAISGPLIAGKLAARLSFSNQDYDGWVKNLYNGEKLGKARDTAARAQLLATPNDDLSILLSAHVRDYSGDPYPFQYRPDYEYAPPRNNGYDDGGADAYGVKNSSLVGTNDITHKGGLLRINWQPGRYSFTSITGIDRNTRTNNTIGSASTPVVNAVAYSETPDRQISQEFRVTSPREDRFNWIAGLHGFRETLISDSFAGNTNLNEGVPTSSPVYTPLSWSETYARTKTQSYAAYASGTYNFTEQLKLTLGGRLGSEKKSFGVRYSYAPQAVATAGQPYISGVSFTDPAGWWRTRSVSGVGGRGLVTPFQGSDSHTWRYATWEATPSYQISKDALAYLRVSRGFLTGGFTQTTSGSALAQNANAQIQPYDPERITTYEAGLKTSWFERRLVVNASAFYYDYPSMQVLVIVPTTVINGVSNVSTGGYSNAAGRVYGLELTVDAQPTEDLHLRAAVGLLDTKYTDYPLTAVSTLPITLPSNYVPIGGGRYAVNPIGGKFTRAPEATLNLLAEYTVPLNWGGYVRFAADYNWRAKQYFNPTFENDPTLVQKAYGLGNARVSWSVDDNERFELAASVLNVFDKKYLDHAIAPSNGVSPTQQGRLRTWLVSATARF